MSKQPTLIKSATVYDPSSKKNGETYDILIKDGLIEQVRKSIPKAKGYKVIEARGQVVIPGLFDLRVRTGDPGNEHKEDLITVTNASVAGGVTGFAALPDTSPVVQSKSIVEYIQRRTSEALADVLVLGAATDQLQGVELTELYDLQLAGVRGFSNGNNTYSDPAVLRRVLMYTRNFGLPVFSHAEEPSIVQNGSVNESEVTIHTGLKVRPAMAEFMEIRRQLDVLRYAGGHLHFSHISTAESVNIISQAQKEGLNVTCDVSINHLAFTDERTLEFDTNYKLLPPLRGSKDRKALIKGILSGVIDAVVSDHDPQNIEEKKKEFDYAAFGAIGIQTMLSMYNMYLADEIPWDKWLEVTVINPRILMGAVVPEIVSGKLANLVVFDPEELWTLNNSTNRSRAANHPLWNEELKGRVKFVCNGSKEYSI